VKSFPSFTSLAKPANASAVEIVKEVLDATYHVVSEKLIQFPVGFEVGSVLSSDRIGV